MAKHSRSRAAAWRSAATRRATCPMPWSEQEGRAVAGAHVVQHGSKPTDLAGRGTLSRIGERDFAGPSTHAHRPRHGRRPRRARHRRRARAWTGPCAGCTSPSSATRRRGCRAASCCSPPAWRSTATARRTSRASPTHGLAGLGVGVEVGGLDTVPDDDDRRGGGARLPDLRGRLRDAVHRAHREGLHRDRQRPGRPAAPRRHRPRAAGARRALRARPRRPRRRARRPRRRRAAVLDARGHVLAEPRDEGTARRPAGCACRCPAPTATAPRRRTCSRRATASRCRELDRLVVHQAVTLVGLELLRRRVAADTERRLAGDVLASVLSGELEGAELERRLAPVRPVGRARLRRRARGARTTPRSPRRRRTWRAPAWPPASARTPARWCRPRPTRTALFELAEARPRAGAGEDLAAGAGRAVALADARRATTRRAGRSRPRRSTARRAAACSPTATSAPSSCCSPCRTTTPCARSATPSSARSSPTGRGLRRRAAALARGLHRVQRAVGARRAPPVLPPAHPPLPDPARGGAHGPLAGLGARPHRLLARPARARTLDD